MSTTLRTLNVTHTPTDPIRRAAFVAGCSSGVFRNQNMTDTHQTSPTPPNASRSDGRVGGGVRLRRLVVAIRANLPASGGHDAGGLQRSQPGGTAARRASSSMAAMALRLASRSALTRSSSAMAVARCCAISARR